MRKRVGLRYCGGCNPCYDRTAAVRRLADTAPHCLLEPFSEGGCYDLILMVCGCLTACASPANLPGTPLFWIRCRDDLDAAEKMLAVL